MKKIKVLIAPGNTASIPNTVFEMLKNQASLQVVAFAYGKHKYWTFHKDWHILDLPIIYNFSFKKYYYLLQFYYHLFTYWYKADIVLWYSGMSKPMFWFSKICKRKVIVEFMGSEIRKPSVANNINPFYKKARENNTYSYDFESDALSNETQHVFKHLNCHAWVTAEMHLYLNHNNYKKTEIIHQRIFLETFANSPPSIHNNTPIIVHAPSSTGAKGTEYIRAVMDKLKSKNIQFSYIEINNKSREEALSAMLQCDIFIDQLIVGSFGMAALEAMAMGKPTLCYVMDDVVRKMPDTFPIVNANPDNLFDVLLPLVNDAALRNNIGNKTRYYVEQHHNATTIANELTEKIIQFYNEAYDTAKT